MGFVNDGPWANFKTEAPDTLENGSVGTNQIVDLSVTTQKLANGSVTTGKLSNALRLSSMRTFDTVAAMQAATDLEAGITCHTNGFHTSGDCGAAYYTISSSGTANGMDVLACQDNLKAALIVTESYVTPEMFGAYGDGTHDDSAALQRAMYADNVICGAGKTYVSGSTLTVHDGLHFDGNNASFVFNCDVGFSGSGSITQAVSANDYSADQIDYSIEDEYDGFVELRGTNNFETSRSYFVGGFVGMIRGGTLDTSYPIPVTSVTVNLISPITFIIENIADVTLNYITYTSSRVFLFKYAVNAIIRNVNFKTNSYSSIRFDSSMNCVIEGCSITHDEYQPTDNYPVMLCDSSFMKVRNCYINNPNWHAISTGGTILCYKNIIEKCVLQSDTVFAFGDHQNALGSVVQDCVTSGITLSGLGIVRDCMITSVNLNAGYNCQIQIMGSSMKRNSGAFIDNVTFQPDQRISSPANVGFTIGSAAQQTNTTYYLDNINVSNVKNAFDTTTPRIILTSPSSTRQLVLGRFIFENIDKTFIFQLLRTSVLSYATITDYTLSCKNTGTVSSAAYTYNNLYIDSQTQLAAPLDVRGIYRANNLSVSATNVAALTSAPSDVQIGLLKVGSNKNYYNVVKIGTSLYGYEYDTTNNTINFVDITTASA